MSTMEYEFIALELAGRKAEWLKSQLANVPLWEKSTPSIALHCDNMTAISVALSKAFKYKRRHIRLRHKIVKEISENGVISLDFMKSEKNLADPLTKGLCRKMVFDTWRGMGLRIIKEF